MRCGEEPTDHSRKRYDVTFYFASYEARMKLFVLLNVTQEKESDPSSGGQLANPYIRTCVCSVCTDESCVELTRTKATRYTDEASECFRGSVKFRFWCEFFFFFLLSAIQ